MDFEEHPDLLKEENLAVWSACEFWENKGLSEYANMDDGHEIWVKRLNRTLIPIEYITWRVNGGFSHLEQREIFYKRAKSIIFSI